MPKAFRSALLDTLCGVGRFARLTVRKASRDGIGRESSALAFNTVLAFVPLLAAFSFVGERFFNEYRREVLAVLGQLLPYSEAALIEQINHFLAQAAHLRGVGLAGFLFVALLSFVMTEGTLNRIWYVSSRRPLRTRLYSFAMLLLWGPLLIGTAYSILLVLRQRSEFEALFEESWLLRAIPLVVTCVGLTMLYWLVPYTAVRFRCALAGGASAALLLELMRIGFKAYLQVFHTMSLVYGGFALLLFFMISIEAAWLLVLLGGVIAYVAQHFRAMAPDTRRAEPLDSRWLGVAAVAALAERRQAGDPAAALEVLAAELNVTTEGLRRALGPLLAGGIVADAGRASEGVLLAAPPEHLEIESVLGLYEAGRRQLLDPLPVAQRERIEGLRRRVLEARRRELGGTTVACLISRPPQAKAAP